MPLPERSLRRGVNRKVDQLHAGETQALELERSANNLPVLPLPLVLATVTVDNCAVAVGDGLFGLNSTSSGNHLLECGPRRCVVVRIAHNVLCCRWVRV